MKKVYQSPASVSFGSDMQDGIEAGAGLAAILVGAIVGGAAWAIGIGTAWLWG